MSRRSRRAVPSRGQRRAASLVAGFARDASRGLRSLGLRGLRTAAGRRARAAGALAVLGSAAGGLTADAYAQHLAPPPVPAGVSTFDPAVGGPAVGGPVVGAPAPERVVRGPEVRSPRFLATNSPFVTRGRIENNIGDGPGYESGYTRLSAFVPTLFADGQTLFFMDLSGFVSYADGGGANLGAGVRRYLPGMKRTFGANAWFDLDSGFEEDVTFERIGFGLESIGENVSWRGNAYVPLDDREDIFEGVVGDAFFIQDRVAFASLDSHRLNYFALENEVGGWLPMAGKYGVSGFVGTYYLLHDQAENSAGFKTRLNWRLSDDLSVGGQVTTDDVFGGNAWATVTLTSPRGSWYDFGRTGWFRKPTVFEQMDDAVVRHHRAYSLRRDDFTNVFVSDEAGGALVVCHVDPLATGRGDGTVENPFRSFEPLLNGANCVDEECDVIRVVASVDEVAITTRGPINLADGQQLLSTAERQTIGAQFRGEDLRLRLPGFTGGERPVLINGRGTQSYVVGLSDNNVVSGFTIDGDGPDGDPFHDGIVSIRENKSRLTRRFEVAESRGRITNFAITNNTFRDVREGVSILHEGSGVGLFTDNDLTGPGFGSGSGFEVSAFGGELDLLVADNTVTQFQGEDADQDDCPDFGEDFGGFDTNGDGIGDGVIDEGVGVRVAALDGAVVDVAVLDNDLTENETGLKLISENGSTLTATVDGNDITDNLGRNTGVSLLAVDGSTLLATVTDNDISDNGLEPSTGATVTFAFDGDDVITIPDADNLDPVQARGDVAQLGTQLLGAALDDSTLAVSAIDNTIGREEAGGDGIALFGRGDSDVTLLAQGNEITGRRPQLATVVSNADNTVFVVPFDFPERLAGILVDVEGGSAAAQIGGLGDGDGNTISDAAGAGIAVLLSGDAEGQIAVEGNTVTDTRYDDPVIGGVFIDITPAAFSATVIGAQLGVEPVGPLTPYDGDGIFVRTTDEAFLSDSVINQNVVDGLADGGVLQADTLLIDNNPADVFVVGPGDIPGDGIEVVAAGASTITNLTIGDPAAPDLQGNAVFDNARGIVVGREDGAVVEDLVIDDNFVFDNVLAGIAADVGGSGERFDFTLRDNQVKDNGGSGLQLNLAGDAVVDVEIVGNAFVGNAIDGIILTDAQGLADAGTVVGLIADNLIADNGIHGIDFQTRTGDPSLGNDGGTEGDNFLEFINDVADRAFAAEENELFVTDNTIRNNGAEGVFLIGAGSATFEDNLIVRNGIDGGLVADTPGGVTASGAGVRIVSGAGVVGGFPTAAGIDDTYFGLNFNRDVIRGNRGDGVELLTAGNPFNEALIDGDANDHFVSFTDVQVTDNAGRGYDILNRAGSRAIVQILGSELSADNSFISGNGGEGVYVVNTAAVAQGQAGPTPQPSGLAPFNPPLADPSHGLLDTGNVDVQPTLNFLFENNVVAGNGADSGFDATGVVIRVGSSGSVPFGGVDPFFSGDPEDPFASGGFASENVYDLAAPGRSGDEYLDEVVRVRSGVVAIVQNNRVTGNFGSDFLFESFVSTVDPIDSAFEEDPFNVTAYQQDPKARLDLVFSDNTFADSDGGTLDGAVTVGAYYDNADAFKSRPVAEGGDLLDPPGPFNPDTPADRRRNAQRLDIPAGVNGTLFPAVGVGESTFRVNEDGTNFVAFPGSGGPTPLSNVELFGPISTPIGEPFPVGFDDRFEWNLED